MLTTTRIANACFGLFALTGMAHAAQPKHSLAAPAPIKDQQAAPTGPVHEPLGSTSSQLRADQALRRELREQIDWGSLDDVMREALWDTLVGPDQLDDGTGHAQVRPSERDGGYLPRGGGYGDRDALVTLSWMYTVASNGNNQTEQDMFLNVEGDILETGFEFLSSGVKNLRITELRGVSDSTEGYTENWSRSLHLSATPNTDGSLWGFACQADLLGNCYIAGQQGNGNYIVHQYSGVNGSTIRQADFSPTGTGSDGFAKTITVDPEGIVYVGGGWTDGGQFVSFVSRHEPRNALARTWLSSEPGNPVVSLKSDRRGGIYAAFTTADGHARVRKYWPYDGTPEWTWTSTAAGDTSVAMDLDSQGNPHLAIYTGNSWHIVKLSEADGSPMWAVEPTVAGGTPRDIKVDASGNVYAVGDSATHTSHLRKWTSSGAVPSGWVSPDYGTTGAGAVRVALDWLGNPYVLGSYGTDPQTLDVRKFDPVNGSQVWIQTHSPTAVANETNRVLYPTTLLVDASGSVYVAGHRYPTVNGTNQASVFFCVKYEQPFVSVPQSYRSTPNAQIENHSIWFPEADDLSQLGFNQSFSLFNFSINNVLSSVGSSESQIDNFLSADIDYVLGTVHGEVDLDLLSNPSIGVDFVTSATGGSYDAKATGVMTISTPGESELIANQTFNVGLEFKPDAASMAMLANSTPSMSASLKSATTGNLDLDVRGRNRNFGGDWNTIFDEDIPTPALSSLDNITLLNIFGANPPAPGTWIGFDVAGVSGRFTMPNLKARGVYTARSVSGSSTSNPGDDDTMRMTSSLSKTFCEAGISVTDMVTTAAVGVPLSFSWELPAGDSGTDVSAGIGILQAHFDGDMKAEQDLTLDMKPYVRLEFPGTTLSPITVDLVKRAGASGNFSYSPESSSITVGPIPANGSLEVRPFFGVRSTMRNQSGLRFGASCGFDTFNVNANVSVLDVDVFNLDYCFGCITQPIFSSQLTLLDRTSPEFAWPEVELASIQVSGDVNTQPQLIGSSRAAARLLIYEQRSPSISELNNLASGTEPVILYGRKFLTGTGQANRAFIRHWGRTEQLSTTRLNDQALLVQIPKRFYLLPGIARLWVTNGNGKSKTLDYPIEYPFPNFRGILGLDGTSDPVIWAGDPRRATSPLVAIDGGTPGGADSFIARRDYFTLLRTSLWNSGLFDAGDPDASLSAQAYFPSFNGWELNGNPKCPPGFPTLNFDGVALGRSRPAINDGYYRSTIQDELYDSPHVATIELVNPGPGGGQSRSLTLSIPAPRPVVNALEPATLTPEAAAAGTIRLVVSGPDSAPYFPGYECVKAGNFTPQSVVLVDGSAVTTQFKNSGQLVATVPGTLLSSIGSHLVTVSTPNGGTTYTEQLRNGLGNWQNPVQVASGGVSQPVTLEVTWGRPEIAGLSYTTLTVATPPPTPLAVNGLPPADSTNFGLTGRNFAPGAVVFWNGRALPTVRVDSTVLRVTLTAADVASVGAVRVWVNNPAPSARSSAPTTVQVVP